jgi:hypothetical protein
MDAVMYLSSALETYRELDPAGQKQLLGEVVAVGQQGLALNNPEPKHHLQHYRGGSIVSGLQAACILYVVCSSCCLGLNKAGSLCSMPRFLCC